MLINKISCSGTAVSVAKEKVIVPRSYFSYIENIFRVTNDLINLLHAYSMLEKYFRKNPFRFMCPGISSNESVGIPYINRVSFGFSTVFVSDVTGSASVFLFTELLHDNKVHASAKAMMILPLLSISYQGYILKNNINDPLLDNDNVGRR